MALLARFDESSLRGSASSNGRDPSILSAERVCMRCKSNNASTSVRGEDVCKDCVVSYISKRARNALTSPPQLAQPVALCVGSGCTSSLLLDHGQGIMHCGRKRRYWQDATVLHVQDSGSSEADKQQELEATKAVLTMSLRSGLQTVVIPIESGVPDSPLCSIIARPPAVTRPDRIPPQHPLTKNYLHEASLVEPIVAATMSALEALRASPSLASWCSQWRAWMTHPSVSADSRQQLRQASIRSLCVEAALHLAIPHVVVGSCVDSLAECVMTSSACGCGSSVPCDVSPIDRRWMRGVREEGGHDQGQARRTLTTWDSATSSLTSVDTPLSSSWYPAQSQEMPLGPIPARLSAQPVPGQGLLLLRPFLEMERQEIQLYVQYRDISMDSGRAAAPVLSPGGPKSSIAAINAAVLANLHASFPATLHNVVRTARKLALPWDEEGFTTTSRLTELRLCPLCQGLLHPVAPGASHRSVQQPAWCSRCERLKSAWQESTQARQSMPEQKD